MFFVLCEVIDYVKMFTYCLDVGCSEMQKNVIAKNVMQKCH